MAENLFNPTASAALSVDGGDKPPKKPAPKPVKVTPKHVPPPVIDTEKNNVNYWKEHPLITEHKDGMLRPWGEDTTAMPSNPNLLPKQMMPPILPSDKAAGLSNTYYPAREQNKGKAVATVNSNIYR